MSESEPEIHCVTRAQVLIEIRTSRPFDGTSTVRDIDRIARRETEEEIRKVLSTLPHWNTAGDVKILYVTSEVEP